MCCRWCRRCCPCLSPRGYFEYQDAGEGADKFFKLVLLGERVGKTALRHRFAQTKHPTDDSSTVSDDPEIDYSVRDMDMGGESMTLHIYECQADGGDQASINPMSSLQLADGIFLVYDVTRKRSLARLEDVMMSDDVLPQLCRAAHVLVVGNKNDLDDGDREISEQDGKAFADRVGAGFVEASAKTGQNVSKALYLMMASISGPGGGANRAQRLKMPWTDPNRLREVFANMPRPKLSTRTSSASLLLGTDDEYDD